MKTANTTTTANQERRAKLWALALITGAAMVLTWTAALTGAGLFWLIPGIPAGIITAAALQELETTTPKK
jgi:hypothetical protein